MKALALNPYSIPMIIAAILCTVLIFYVKNKRGGRAVQHLVALLILVDIWCLSYAAELCLTDTTHKLIAIMVQYIAIPSVPVLFAVFVYCFTHKYKFDMNSRRPVLISMIVPVCVTLLMLTNSLHHIMYTGWTLTNIPGTGYTFLFPHYGVGFLISTIYSYGCMIFAFIYIFYISIKTTKLFSAQAILLLCCALIPIIFNLLYFNKETTYVNFDITPIASLFAAGLLTYLVTGTALLDLQPLARDIIIENADYGTILLDSHNKVLDLNPMTELIFSVKKSDVVGDNSLVLLEKLPPVSLPPLQQTMTEFSLGDRIFTLSTLPMQNKYGVCDGQILSIRDITDRKAAEKYIERLAYQDPLTDLPNHTSMLQKLDALINYAIPHGFQVLVLHVHINNINYINSAYGHDMGDALFQKSAEMIGTCIWKTDVFARTKGEGFLVAIPVGRTARTAARLLADKLLQLFAHPIRLKDNCIFAAVDIGISLSPDNGDDAGMLVKKASLALEQARISRTHYAFYSSEKEHEIAERNALLNDMRTAIDSDQFSLAYQPQYNRETHTLCGVEALLRWTHPTLGNVPPDKFVYLLEDSGLIVPVGSWVIEQAARQYKKWRQMGLDIPKYSVNLSVRQFESDDLVPHILHILDSEGIPRHCLEVEVTETLAAVADKHVVSQIRALSDAGVHIAIDDFGSGFSSLTYFKYLNINTLKVDKVISADIHLNKYSCAIFKSLKLLCDSLGVDIITEYVETDAQIRKLSHLGCKNFQGFFYSKPLPPNELEAFVKSLSVDTMLFG